MAVVTAGEHGLRGQPCGVCAISCACRDICPCSPLRAAAAQAIALSQQETRVLSAENATLRERFAQSPDGPTADQASCPRVPDRQPAASFLSAAFANRAHSRDVRLHTPFGASCARIKLSDPSTD
jgi:hypothetical protein